MTVTLYDQIQANNTLRGVLTVDADQRLRVADRNKALLILAQADTNSVEYRLVQVAMQIINFQEQDELAAKVRMGELEIRNLQGENRRISDELTTKQIREDSDQLRAAETRDGVVWLATTIPLTFFIPPIIFIGPIIGLTKILTPGSKAMRHRETEMELYKAFHPTASLTEIYSYVKANPLNYDLLKLLSCKDAFLSVNPNGTYEEFVQYVVSQLPKPTRMEIVDTGRGPTGFQFVEKCDDPNCSGCREY